MADVFEVLRKDHEEIKRVLNELERGLRRLPEAQADELGRQEKLVEHLVIEASKHETVEEEYFWPVVRDRLADGDRLADEAIQQEQDGKYVLNDLIGLSAKEPQFADLVGTFIRDGRAHIAFEEDQVLPGLQRALSQEQAEALGTKLEQAKKIAPTRPHPHTPPRPGVLKAVGSAAAAVDRVRDAITRRGKD